MSLNAFFKHGLDSCENRQCYLELNLIGSLELAGSTPIELHPENLIAPYLEYQIQIGRSEGDSGGEILEANDTRPVITSIGESGGYSVREQAGIEEELLIPSVSSPIGR